MGFPSWKSASVGMGTGMNINLKKATSDLRTQAGLDKCSTIRKEGARSLKPLERWDNGILYLQVICWVLTPSSRHVMQ